MTDRKEYHHHGRQIPWLPVVRFHKEIVTRAEQSVFSLNGGDDQAGRWSSLTHFAAGDLAGPWSIAEEQIRSRPFRLAVAQERQGGLFLGGPCFLGWTWSMGKWLPQWRPLLYREVALHSHGSNIKIVPQQGRWSLSPLPFARMEINVGLSPDDFAASLIETAAGYPDDEPIDRRIFRALFDKVPGIESKFTEPIRPDMFRVRPTPWVLFAPVDSFSYLTRHLMQDYERLEVLLARDDADIGGLRLLEGRPEPDETPNGAEVLPLIPLNRSQCRAVQRILERCPLTVISGPPGTGKSQVVVSLLLNAWAQGKSVLFASNNNKAVDVVRERVERFESEFPIAVRAGAKQRQNIQEVLRRTLNMAATSAAGKGVNPADIAQRKQSLLQEHGDLSNALKLGLHQRIDELRKSALRAYGEYRSTLSDLKDREQALRARQQALGFGGQPIVRIEEALRDTCKWLDRIGDYRNLVKADNQLRSELCGKILDHERLRNRAVEEVGLRADDAGDWCWLMTGPSAGLVADWEQRLRTLLARPIDQALEPVEWHDEYARWQSAEQAENWAREARIFAETILRTCAEIAPKIVAVRKLSQSMDEERSRVTNHGLPEDLDLPPTALRDWTAVFAELATREPHWFDSLPWSQQARLKRTLKRLERQIRPGLPLAVLMQIGALDDKGRSRLALVVEVARRWLELRKEWETAYPLIQETENRFRDLRSQGVALKLQTIPNDQDTEAWTPISAHCEQTAMIADSAATAWHRRAEKERTAESLRTIAKEWGRIASGVPVREAWRRGQGHAFDEALRGLADRPGSESTHLVREALYSGVLTHLLECWRNAADQEQAAAKLRIQMSNLPELADRVKAWWAERPTTAFVLSTGSKRDWPDLEKPKTTVERVTDWCEQWNRFKSETEPEGLKKSKGELDWAVAKLKQAIDLLPDGSEKTRVATIFRTIKTTPDRDWPIPDLNHAFNAFGPDRIRGRIGQIEAALERSSFEDAKTRWLERLRSDDGAIRAVDALEKSVRRYRGEVPESHYGTFRTALRAVPIWITTAQASQAIPLQPELFDIVVIDEASQCTLTNLLPLMYRGSTLAVIGDEHQLPAIPTIQESEELELARKFEIEDLLSLVGHAANNVYMAATDSLPRLRADVIMLDEHFRSHPQIIGFSNRYIYLQRLELKKDPSWRKQLPIASGVHSIPVTGETRRGRNGRSWINIPEAEEVLKKIQDLKQRDSRSLSVGVVTPFKAQKDFLRDRLDALRLASEVLVDTAHGFQGDERDIIIFSPVVSKGITKSASRWVESPENLINVTVTRAREALIVIGDLEYCRHQNGILRKLALYCNDVQKLRDESPAELELFSWMVVKGWEPKVHPPIGDIKTDFVIESKSDFGIRVAIEVDGREHHEGATEKDKARDVYLQGQGYEVIRIPAREVLETPFKVIHQIESRLQGH